jgi:dUTP pyrophosphatase
MKATPQFGAVLSRSEIEILLKKSPPLIEGLIDKKQQLQPNGVDLTVRSIAILSSQGKVGAKNEERVLSRSSPLVFDGLGCIDLVPGQYLVTFNEVVHLPKDIMALARPRSSLLRCGVTVETAVWDAGYEGRSQSLLVVHNPYGFRLERNSRLIQLVFFRLTSEAEGYQGIFQGENI